MTVTLHLSTEDAYRACEAIASHRVWKHCECEDDVGYTCGFCKAHHGPGRRRPDLNEVVVRYGEMLFASLQKDQAKDALLSASRLLLEDVRERHRHPVTQEVDHIPLIRDAEKAIAAMETRRD